MRSLLLSAAAAVMLSTPVQAAVNSDLCTTLADIAWSAMFNRQRGTSIEELRASLSSSDAHPDLVALIMNLVELAYDEPMYLVPSNQLQAARDFRIEVLSTCQRRLNHY